MWCSAVAVSTSYKIMEKKFPLEFLQNVTRYSKRRIFFCNIDKIAITARLLLPQGKSTYCFLTSRVGGRVVRWSWVNFQCRCVVLIWMIVRQGPILLAVGADGGCSDILLSIISLLFLPLSGRRPDMD